MTGFRIACRVLRRSRSRKEVVHVNNSFGVADRAVDRRAAHMALQPELGILPQRRSRPDRPDSPGSRAHRENVGLIRTGPRLGGPCA